MDVMEAKWLWKEGDNLLQAIEELYTGAELAYQEYVDVQQRVSHLEKELWRERDLKVVAEGGSTSLAAEVRQCQEEVRRLEAEVTRQRDEVRTLWADVDGKSLVSLVVFLPRIRGRLFDTIGM